MEGYMKELCRVIKYALDTQNIGLRLKPEDNDNEQWELNSIETLQETKKQELA